MKAIQVTCPHCGARLRADETSAIVTCEYCGTASAIQRRTRILERVVPPPPQVQPVQTKAVKYAVQRHTGAWKLAVLLAGVMPALIIGGVVFSAVRETRQAERQIRDAQRQAQQQLQRAGVASKIPPAERPPTWQGTSNVLVADIEGDGTPELVGRGRQVNAGDIIRVIALDLATGKLKWQSEPLGTYSDTYRGPLAIAGDLVMFASAKGEVQAIALRDGKHAWRVKLDERVEAFCAGADAATVVAVGADGKLRTLARTDGALVGTSAHATGKARSKWDRPPPCALLPADGEPEFARLTTRHRGGRIDRPGLDVTLAIDVPGGGTVLSAARKEGTRVTTVVALDAKGEEKWRANAAVDALTAEGAPRYVVASEREACIIYYGTEYRIACFAMADGKRLWDVAAPATQEALVIVGRSLVVTTHRGLHVLDLDTGKQRWVLD